MPHTEVPVRWRQAFRDVDRSEAAVGDVFHRHSLAVDGPRGETFGCNLDATRTGPVVIGRLDYSVDMRLNCPYVDGYHVNIPVRGALDSLSGRNDLRLLPGTAALYDKHVSAVLGTQLRSGLGMFALKIQEQALEGALACMLGHPIRTGIHLAPLLDLAGGAGRQWWQLTTGVLWRPSRYDLLTHPLVARPAVEAVLNGLLLAARHQYSEALHDLNAATPTLIRRAQSFIAEHLEEPLSSITLARDLGVSARSLQRGFSEHLGLTPGQYIRARRLERAHLDLVSGARDGVRVTDIAVRWGFLNPGRFAAEYRARYGHPPAAELHRPGHDTARPPSTQRIEGQPSGQ
jgi:AraC-like DNA-binding protein